MDILLHILFLLHLKYDPRVSGRIREHYITDLPVAALHHSARQPISVAPLKGQTVYSSKTKPVHPSESLPLQRATVHFPSLCFKGLAP